MNLSIYQFFQPYKNRNPHHFITSEKIPEITLRLFHYL